MVNLPIFQRIPGGKSTVSTHTGPAVAVVHKPSGRPVIVKIRLQMAIDIMP